MKQQQIIVIPINDTEYRFELKHYKEQLSQCYVTISFFSLERNWVLLFEGEEMLFNLGVWYFKRRELPERLLQQELVISQYLIKQTETA